MTVWTLIQRVMNYFSWPVHTISPQTQLALNTTLLAGTDRKIMALSEWHWNSFFIFQHTSSLLLKRWDFKQDGKWQPAHLSQLFSRQFFITSAVTFSNLKINFLWEAHFQPGEIMNYVGQYNCVILRSRWRGLWDLKSLFWRCALTDR